ncbi:MAG TPA: GNAT family protein [Polyangia bacterium]|nr:GNAT family protein [Polyangia bacterium]
MTRLGFESRFGRLEPLSLDHVDALVAAATTDRSTFELAPVPRDRDEMVAYVAAALADEQAGRALPYVVVPPSGSHTGAGHVLGSIRFMSLEWWTWPPGPISVAGEPRRADAGDPPDVAEIGHAWLAPSAQRTGVFTASALHLLAHAFDTWRVHRLVLKTDVRNARSRAAIERLGGRLEGVLRAHLPAADGRVRDTAMFSIVRDEWAGVRKRLESALGGPL